MKWLKGLLNDFQVKCDKSNPILEDNQSMIHLLNKWEHSRLKHIDVKYNFVRNLYNSKEIDVTYISAKEQTADLLTLIDKLS